MSLVGFTFGSFGDIITIIQLANKVRKLLSESSGASVEYQQLISEIDTSRFILHLVHGASLLEGTDPSPLSRDAQQTIQQCIKNSESILRGLEGKICNFRESLQKGGTGKRMLDSWRKMAWGFFKNDYLIEARRRLAEQSQWIRLLLGVDNTDFYGPGILVGGRFGPGESTYCTFTTKGSSRVLRADEPNKILRDLTHNAGFRHAHAWFLNRDPGETDGCRKYLMNLWSKKYSIILLDMLGQKIRLPFQLCGSWEDFNDFIRFYFRKRAGRRLVKRGAYDVVLSSSGRIQTSVQWEISAGATVMMNARIQRPENREGNPKAAICPSCDFENMRNADTGINCSHCGAWFMTSNSTIDELGGDQTPTQEHHDDDFAGDSNRAAEQYSSQNGRPERGAQKQTRRGARVLLEEDSDFHFLRRIRVIVRLEEAALNRVYSFISYDMTGPPSARTVLDRTTHSPVPAHTLAQPATEPPIPASQTLVLRSDKIPWRVTVGPIGAQPPSGSLGKASGTACITNLDVLYALHNQLMKTVTTAEWESLGEGSSAQRKVAAAYEKRCTRSGGGWEHGIRRVDWLSSKTRLVGVEVDKSRSAGGCVGTMVFGKA